MNHAFAAACLWLIAANVIAMTPTRDYHWRAAYGLMTIALPILIWLTFSAGPLWSAAFLIAAGSILRWPVRYAWRWVKRRIGRNG